ncbi:hypothetical protein BJ742DRAFT_836911 [Cladochytrium replicatum]|nr:hypothetical protein BJ742DRAFT_836911 [Cladochytrium replicatum]
MASGRCIEDVLINPSDVRDDVFNVLESSGYPCNGAELWALHRDREAMQNILNTRFEEAPDFEEETIVDQLAKIWKLERSVHAWSLLDDSHEESWDLPSTTLPMVVKSVIESSVSAIGVHRLEAPTFVLPKIRPKDPLPLFEQLFSGAPSDAIPNHGFSFTEKPETDQFADQIVAETFKKPEKNRVAPIITNLLTTLPNFRIEENLFPLRATRQVQSPPDFMAIVKPVSATTVPDQSSSVLRMILEQATNEGWGNFPAAWVSNGMLRPKRSLADSENDSCSDLVWGPPAKRIRRMEEYLQLQTWWIPAPSKLPLFSLHRAMPFVSEELHSEEEHSKFIQNLEHTHGSLRENTWSAICCAEMHVASSHKMGAPKLQKPGPFSKDHESFLLCLPAFSYRDTKMAWDPLKGLRRPSHHSIFDQCVRWNVFKSPEDGRIFIDSLFALGGDLLDTDPQWSHVLPEEPIKRFRDEGIFVGLEQARLITAASNRGETIGLRSVKDAKQVFRDRELSSRHNGVFNPAQRVEEYLKWRGVATKSAKTNEEPIIIKETHSRHMREIETIQRPEHPIGSKFRSEVSALVSLPCDFGPAITDRVAVASASFIAGNGRLIFALERRGWRFVERELNHLRVYPKLVTVVSLTTIQSTKTGNPLRDADVILSGRTALLFFPLAYASQSADMSDDSICGTLLRICIRYKHMWVVFAHPTTKGKDMTPPIVRGLSKLSAFASAMYEGSEQSERSEGGCVVRFVHSQCPDHSEFWCSVAAKEDALGIGVAALRTIVPSLETPQERFLCTLPCLNIFHASAILSVFGSIGEFIRTSPRQRAEMLDSYIPISTLELVNQLLNLPLSG